MDLDKISFKVQVTPEQSEQLQLAVFTRGGGWNGANPHKVQYTESPFLYLHGRHLSFGTDLFYFETRKEGRKLHFHEALTEVQGIGIAAPKKAAPKKAAPKKAAPRPVGRVPIMDLPLNELIEVLSTGSLSSFQKVLTRASRVDGSVSRFLSGLIRDRNAERDGWYQWMTPKNMESVSGCGKWTTRFAKAYRKETGASVPPSLLADMGETLRAANIYSEKPAFLEIVNDIDWESGAFGDNDSCWWEENHRSFKFRNLFFASGEGYAVKFFESREAYADSRTKGIGRGLFAVKENHCFLFNGRGGSITTTLMAETLSRASGKPYDMFKFNLPQSYTDGQLCIIGDHPYPKTGVKLTFAEIE